MEVDPIAPGNDSGNNEDTFDRAIWKDRQDILQLFDISVRTLARWREKEGLRMRKYKGKYFYDIKHAEQLYKEKNKKEEKLAKLPVSVWWMGFWIAETIILFVPMNSYVKVLTLAIPLIIVVPADVIIRIRKRREKKKQLQEKVARKQRSRRNH